MEHNAQARQTVSQFIKFALVGVMNTIVDFAVFQALNLLLGWVYFAQVIGYCCGLVNSYLWNSSWTFRQEKKRTPREMLLFLLVNLVTLGVSLGVLWLCKNPIGITDAYVASFVPQGLSGFVNGDTVCKLISIPFSIIVNFIGNKLLVFRSH